MVKGWNKIVIQDDSRSLWIKYRNETKKRELHIANQSYGNKFYVEHLWLKKKYKTFETKPQAMEYAIKYMKAHPRG